MRRIIGLMMVVGCLALIGCASSVRYGDATAVETIDETFGSTDLQTTANKMVDSLLTFPPVVEITEKNRPVIIIDRVRNKTDEHIDTESITDSIVNQLMRSGKFQFVDQRNLQAVREQLQYQQASGSVDPATAVKVGRQVGAQYMMYGNISNIVKKNKGEKDVYYKLTFKLLDLESGLLVWQDEKEIRKQ
jgi:uncharacterized protein (TIGR02722 family)